MLPLHTTPPVLLVSYIIEIMSTAHYNLDTNTDRLHTCFCDVTCLHSVSYSCLTAALCQSCPFAVQQIGLACRSCSNGTLCSTQSACWKALCSRRSKSWIITSPQKPCHLECITVMHMRWLLDSTCLLIVVKVKGKVKFALEQITKTQRDSRGIALFFL
jgi:hypothetical protein